MRGVKVAVDGGRRRAGWLAALMKTTALVAALAALAPVAVPMAPAHAQQPAGGAQGGERSFDIPAQPLLEALIQFGRQAGLQVSADAALVRDRHSPGVTGTMSREQALARLLSGSGLGYRLNGSMVALEKLPEAAGAVLLDPVTVQGRGATTEGSGSYASGSVTIGKGVQDIQRIPQSVSVVTRKQMDDRNVQTIDDALEEAPSVALYDSPMGARYVYSRGFMVDTYQYDGVNRSLYYPQANSFSEDMAAYDRVEVLRGASGLLQGAGNPGAAVNLVRKRPLDQRKVTATGQIGSRRNYTTELDATGPLNGDGSLRGRAVGSFNDRDHATDLAKSRNLFLYGVLEADLSDSTTVGFGGSYKKRDSTPCFHGLPTYSDGADIGLPRRTCLGQGWNSWDTTQLSLFGDVTSKLSDRWTWKTALNYWKEQHDIKYAFSEGTINRATRLGSTTYAGLFDIDSANYSADSYLDGTLDLFGRTHSLTVGASLSRLTNDSDFSLARLGVSQNVFDPVTIAEPADAWLAANRYRGADVRTKTQQEGVYGVARVSLLDPLTAIVGGRVSWYRTTSAYRDTGAQYAEPFRESGVFTPYGGLVYDLAPNLSVYASYADIFKPQSAVTAAGEVLKPIVGANYEVGVKGTLLGGRLNGSLALFRIDNENRAELDSVNYPCAASPSGACYVSSGKVRSQGFEIEAGGEALPGLQLAASYTYARTKYLSGTNAVTQSFTTYNPEHIVKLWGDYALSGPLDGLSVGSGVHFQSASRRTTGAVTLRQPSYAVWNARVGYQLNEHLSAAVNVDNLFDRTYYQTIGAPGWGNFYGEPRTVTLTVKGTF